jgi:hypothetical protein
MKLQLQLISKKKLKISLIYGWISLGISKKLGVFGMSIVSEEIRPTMNIAFADQF